MYSSLRRAGNLFISLHKSTSGVGIEASHCCDSCNPCGVHSPNSSKISHIDVEHEQKSFVNKTVFEETKSFLQKFEEVLV